MRILFLHKYNNQAAAYRYRFEQYFPRLKALGWSVTSQSLLDNAYLKDKFDNKPTKVLGIVKSYLERIWLLLTVKDTDLVVVYMEVFPYLPFFIEYLLILRKIPYVVDLDDAIYLGYSTHRNFLVRMLLGTKFNRIFKHAACVMTGNAHLQSHVRKYNSRVVLVPTVVDMEYYRQSKDFKAHNRPVTIGWAGSPSTAKSLLSIAEALAHVAEIHPVEFLIVGSGPLPQFAPNMILKDWALEDEVPDLMKMDIGIMPLEDTEWNRGKCGFKLIQYMACGLPVVGSPVGVNQKIIDHGTNGYKASSTKEWVKALSTLIESRELMSQLGRNGRAKIANEYSLNFATPVVAAALNSASPLSRSPNGQSGTHDLKI